MHDDIETRLRQALVVAPSDDGLRWLDRRVEAVMARPAVRPAKPRPRLRILARALALVAAFVVVTGTVVGAMGLLERTIDAVPGWRAAWDRAEVIGLSDTADGVTVTLQRAYADLNQVMVFLDVEGVDGAVASGGERPALTWSADLRGPGEQVFAWSTGSAGIESTVAAIVQSWGAPEAAAGTYHLRIDCLTTKSTTVAVLCVDPVADPWEFRFDLPKPAGTVLTGPVTVEHAGATVTLSELRITPTMVSGRLALTIDVADATSWGTTEATVRHGAESYVPNSGYHVTQNPLDRGPYGDEIEFSTPTGTIDAGGAWQIEIREIWYVAGTGGPDSMVYLAGPWIMSIAAP